MSIFEQLGSKKVLEAIVDNFYARVLLDISLKPYFKNIDMKALREHQIAFLFFVLADSKEPYSGPSLSSAHKGMNIKEEDFMKVVNHFHQALISSKVEINLQKQIMDIVLSTKNQIINM